MKRIFYLSLLLVIPFFLHADHGRDRINGKWISPYFGTKINVKVKRKSIKVKGLPDNGWTRFDAVRRGVFEDREGNVIQIRNIHDLTFISNCRDERIKFVKRGHNHHGHTCSASCGLGNDYFDYEDGLGEYGDYDDYGNNWDVDDYYNDYSGYEDYEYSGNRRNNRYRNNRFANNRNRISGKYFVREIDEHISIKTTRRGIKAKRNNGKWTNYVQNRYRKNEYIDTRGNKYRVRRDGSLIWQKHNGKVTLNLERK